MCVHDVCINIRVCFAVPSTVTALQADREHTTHSLTVTWEHPTGVYDGYVLQLLDENSAVVTNATLPAASSSHLVPGLTPGRWYRVRLQTLSGDTQSPDAIAEGQTRKTHTHTHTLTLTQTYTQT